MLPEIYYSKKKKKNGLFSPPKKKTTYRKALPIYGLGTAQEDVVYCRHG
jgi:hypothetical protein